MKNKKSIMGQIVSVFILVLVISILAGLTFLFVSSLKVQVTAQAPFSDAATVTNESLVTLDATNGDYLANSVLRNAVCTITAASNNSAGGGSGKPVTSQNYTVSGCLVKGVSGASYVGTNLNVTYTYIYQPYTIADNAVNDTEIAGYSVTSYLSILFLAIIFGAILAIVLKIILPYINLGRQMQV